jgi:hypothetical protein
LILGALAIDNKATLHIFHANTLLNPKCSFGTSVGITMRFNAGSGKDSILINASNISALEQTGAGNRARVDGGGGVDTITMSINIISNTILSLDFCLDKA